MKKTIFFICTFLFSFSLTFVFGQYSGELFELGKKHFEKRADFSEFEITSAIFYFDEAIYYHKKDKFYGEEEEQISVYLLRSYYYLATFKMNDAYGFERKWTYESAVGFGEKQMKRFPNSPGIIYWYLANFGKWLESEPVLKKIKRGSVTYIKELAEKLTELDPRYEDGGGYRILGILCLKVPRIPFWTWWATNERAINLLEKSESMNHNNLLSRYYCALAWVKEGQERIAWSYLIDFEFAKSSEERLLEDNAMVLKINQLMESIEDKVFNN